MKQFILLLIINLLSIYTGEAQHKHLPHMNKGFNEAKNSHLTTIKKGGEKKTRAIDQRMSALSNKYNYMELNGTNLFLMYANDSGHFSYTGQRGSRWVHHTADNVKYFCKPIYDIAYWYTYEDEMGLYSGRDSISSAMLMNPFSKALSVYNVDQTLASIEYLNWDTVTLVWNKMEKTHFEYDSNQQIIGEFQFKWNTALNQWDSSAKTYSAYNLDQQLVSKTSWAVQGTQWKKKRAYSYNYDVNKNLVEKIDRSNWSNVINDWYTQRKDSLSYTPNQIIVINSYYHLASGTFINVSKLEEEIIHGNQFTSGMEYKWDTVLNNWAPSPVYIDSAWYNLNDKIVKYHRYELNGTLQLIQSYDYQRDLQDLVQVFEQKQPNEHYKYDYTYNSYDNLTFEHVTMFNDSSGNWDPLYTSQYYYEEYDNGSPAGIPTEQAFQAVSIYPNPAINQTYLSYFANDPTPSIIEVFDIYGRMIYRIHEDAYIGDHLVKLPTHILSEGCYLVKISSSNKVQSTLKFMKQ